MVSEDTSRAVEFIYRESNDYRIVYVNGIYGGLNNRGDIKFDLFHEYNPIPEADVHELTDDGRLGERIEQRGMPENTIIRERVIGVVMTPQIARSIGQWLIDKADEYDELVEEMTRLMEGEECQ